MIFSFPQSIRASIRGGSKFFGFFEFSENLFHPKFLSIYIDSKVLKLI